MKDYFERKDQFMGKTMKKKSCFNTLNTQYYANCIVQIYPQEKGKEIKFSNMYNLFCKHREYRSSLFVSQHCRKSICI